MTLPIEGLPTTFSIDRGAARSVLRTEDLPDHSYLSNIDISCVGVEGTPRTNLLTHPLQIGKYPDLLARFVASSTCPLNLLGADVLSRLQASTVFSEHGSITVSSPLGLENTSALLHHPSANIYRIITYYCYSTRGDGQNSVLPMVHRS